MTRVVLEGTDIVVLLAGTPELFREIEDWRNSKCSAHPRREWRRFRTSNGGYQVRAQCLDCGYILGGPRKQTPEDRELPEVDLDAYDAYEEIKRQEYARIEQRHAALQHRRENSFFLEYEAYLNSPEWRRKRELVLRRAKGTCEGCGLRPAKQVHHLTYRHKMAEFLFELVAVCDECHERLHQPDTADGNREGTDTEADAEDDIEPPCCDCTWSGFKGDRYWCFQFDEDVKQAISPRGSCGPDRQHLRPLK